MKIRLTSQSLLVFWLALASASAGLLDGTSWQVQAVPTVNTDEKGAERFDDVLTFSEGQLTSKKLQAAGIGPVAYTSKGTKDFTNWETAPVLKEKNKAQWDGVIKEQDIKGNLKWVTKEGRVLYFFINGKKR